MCYNQTIQHHLDKLTWFFNSKNRYLRVVLVGFELSLFVKYYKLIYMFRLSTLYSCFKSMKDCYDGWHKDLLKKKYEIIYHFGFWSMCIGNKEEQNFNHICNYIFSIISPRGEDWTYITRLNPQLLYSIRVITNYRTPNNLTKGKSKLIFI